jgi:hypothetical protein
MALTRWPALLGLLHLFLQRINAYLTRWIRKQYKRLRGFKQARTCWGRPLSPSHHQQVNPSSVQQSSRNESSTQNSDGLAPVEPGAA